MEYTPLKLLAQASQGPAKIRQLWKIHYYGSGSVSIRSLYKLDMGLYSSDDNVVSMTVVGTTTDVPNANRWTIVQEDAGYVFRHVGTTSKSMCATQVPYSSDYRPTTAVYVSGVSEFYWELKEDTSVVSQVLLINTQAGLPAQNAVRYVYPGETITLEDMNLTASFVSRYTNEQDFQWLAIDDSAGAIVTVDKDTGDITGVSDGQTTITAKKIFNGVDYTKTFTIVVLPIVDGTYYIRSWSSGLNIEVGDKGDGTEIYLDTFSNTSSQKWTFTHRENGIYTIRSTASGNYYLGVYNDSTDPGIAIVPRTGSLTDGMKWKIETADSGALLIRPYATAYKDYVLGYNPMAYEYQLLQMNYSNTEDDSGEWLACAVRNEIRLEGQETGDWCWLAAARMASSLFMDTPITQASAAVYVKLGIRTLHPTEEQVASSNDGGQKWETNNALRFYIGTADTFYVDHQIFSEATLRSLLDAGNVIILSRGEYNSLGVRTSGHATVVAGYSYSSEEGIYMFDIFDPSPMGQGRIITRSYSWICNGKNAVHSEEDDNDERIWDGVAGFAFGDYENTIDWPGVP